MDTRCLDSLLYADDVVLLADSVEDLQSAIETVDLFCRQWRININLGKSKAMVIPASGTAESEEWKWTCRGKEVPKVESYKYLGMWFQKNLLWNQHANVMSEKGKTRNARHARVLHLPLLPNDAKLRYWSSVVRSALTYGLELIQYNASDLEKLERVQTQALTSILRCNARTKAMAMRAAAGIKSLSTEAECRRLGYWAKLVSMEKSRWARALFETKIGKSKIRGPSRARWRTATESLLEQSPQSDELDVVRTQILDAMAQSHDVLKDDQLRNQWVAAVQKWGIAKEIQMLAEESDGVRSTLKVIERMKKKTEVWKPIPVVTKHRTAANQTRIRFAMGTTALYDTISKWNDVGSGCPMCVEEGKPAPKETVSHFLLECPAYGTLRENLFGSIRSCAKSWAFFSGLDDTGKQAFILGGPVDGCPVSQESELECEKFVSLAYSQRSSLLESLSDAESSDSDSDGVDGSDGSSEQPSITSFFAATSSSSKPTTTTHASPPLSLSRVPSCPLDLSVGSPPVGGVETHGPSVDCVMP